MPAFASPHRAAFGAGTRNVLLRGNVCRNDTFDRSETYVKSIFALLSQKVTKAELVFTINLNLAFYFIKLFSFSKKAFFRLSYSSSVHTSLHFF